MTGKEIITKTKIIQEGICDALEEHWHREH